MEPMKLVKMVNEIAAFFGAEPDRAVALEGVAQHLKRFWDPRMRRELLAWVDQHGGAGLVPSRSTPCAPSGPTCRPGRDLAARMPVRPPRPASASLRRGAALSLLSATLFGVSAPWSKRLLPGAGPLSIAGTLYLAGGIGLLFLPALVSPLRRRAEAPLTRHDVPTLAGVVLLGGVVAPVLLLVGLGRVSGVVGSLLLNMEAPLTILVAVVAFGEHLGARGLACVASVLAGSVVLTLGPADGTTDPLGALAVAGACLLWALDNNLTQRLSGKDPVAITRVKCLVAGATNLGLAVLLGHALPDAGGALAAAVLGFLAFGVGLVLATLGMRALGAARHAVLFATAPFVGAWAAVPLLGETPRLLDLVGMGLMAAGVAVLLGERHEHAHGHEALRHDHLHAHDDHHAHAHGPEDPVEVPHAHPHRHDPLVHAHAHASDLHHRHDHPAGPEARACAATPRRPAGAAPRERSR